MRDEERDLGPEADEEERTTEIMYFMRCAAADAAAHAAPFTPTPRHPMSRHIVFSDRNESTIKAFRNVMQKFQREEQARAALAEAYESEDAERMRLAREAFDHQTLLFDTAILDLRDTLLESLPARAYPLHDLPSVSTTPQ